MKEIIIDKEDKTKKHRNNEIDCLYFSCRKGENNNVLFWCDFYDDHCDNYIGCYYRKYLRLEQENEKLKEENRELEIENVRLQNAYRQLLAGATTKLGVANQKLEKIKEMCKNAISECSCKNPNKDVDCFECTSGGRAELGKEILEIIEEK